ncbi:MAG: N-formylglutamate amidohydrolase [Candidatus Binataceae bacterium]
MKVRSAAVTQKSTEAAGAAGKLIAADEPAPFCAERREGRSNFVIVVDHASARIPRVLGDLGLPPSQLNRNIAWDIGALAVARQVAEALDAAMVAQNYSRLVIDSNRDPRVASSIPTMSEASEIPGNIGLTEEQRETRRKEIFEPYHDHIGALIDERAAAGRPTILVAQHSMTEVYNGVRREMQAAVLYNRDRRFAGLVLEMLRREAELVIGDNQPYFVSDETDFTIPYHGEKRDLPHVEIEIRQDLLGDEAGQREWAMRITRVLQEAERAFHGAAT